MKNLIEVFKKIRKKQQINKQYSTKYAFIGIGNHSINNLYPVLNYLNVPLKYIVTKNKDTADLVNNNYPSVIGTNDINQVMEDNEVGGVFICANPTSHYQLVKKALTYNKNVFVEKPPCLTIVELEDLINQRQQSGKTCLVGVQKRYSECTKILQKKLASDKVISYNYRFVLGAYPEGDDLMDLFIHPLDLVNYLFGQATLLSSVQAGSKKGQITYFIHTKHSNNVIGNIEISTNYSWSTPDEHLLINSQNGVYDMKNHQLLTFQKKQGVFFSIPIEKILPSPPEIQYLFNTNSFMPIITTNQLYAQGYYGEINNFVNLCEGKKAKNLSSLESLLPTFSLIQNLRNTAHV